MVCELNRNATGIPEIASIKTRVTRSTHVNRLSISPTSFQQTGKLGLMSETLGLAGEMRSKEGGKEKLIIIVTINFVVVVVVMFVKVRNEWLRFGVSDS